MIDERDDASRSAGSAYPDAELFSEVIGRELASDPNHPMWEDRRFLEWLAVEARSRDRVTRRMSDASFVRRGEELMARAHARLLRVERRGSARLVPAAPTHEGRGSRRERPAPVIELGIAAGVGRELWDERVEAWVEVPPELPSGDYLALKIVGESMTPLMHTGDTVLVRVGSEVQRDTVIVARHPDDGYVCKRVSRLRRGEIELSSLEPGRPLITIPRDPRLILGTVLLVWCQHRR
jgi:SOS-response transcriptional repressor LexA